MYIRIYIRIYIYIYIYIYVRTYNQYYQSCLGCSLTGMQVKFSAESSTLQRSKRRGRQTVVVRNFSKQTC